MDISILFYGYFMVKLVWRLSRGSMDREIPFHGHFIAKLV